MKRLLFLILLVAGLAQAGDIAPPVTLSDGSTYHAADFNNIFAGEVIQPSFISSKSSATPVSADEFVFWQSGTTSLKQTTLATLAGTVQATAPRVTTITSSATPAVNTDVTDAVSITAQAAAITSMTSSLTGTPNNFQQLMFRILDNGTPRAITWGSSFIAKGAALPTTTTASKCLTVLFVYDSVVGKWGCVSVANES